MKPFENNELINTQFEVRQRLSGGMGFVYIVFDQVSERMFALKTVRQEFADDPQATERFEREARNWINIGRHRNIVQAISFHRVPFPMLLLEFIEGTNLRDLLKREHNGLALTQVVGFARQLAEGLKYAQECEMPGGRQGVVHRDLKPANILVDRKGFLKITDFGLARSQADQELTSSGRAMGTAPYMPPEQFRDAHAVSFKADLYAFGVILYEMLTGRLPLPCGSMEQIMYHAFHTLPEPVSSFRNDVPEELERVIHSCLAKLPEDRPASALSVLTTLHELTLDLPEDKAHLCPHCGFAARQPSGHCPVCDSVLASSPPIAEAVVLESTVDAIECSCGHVIRRGFRFCVYCGGELSIRCRTCETQNPARFKFCCKCGDALTL